MFMWLIAHILCLQISNLECQRCGFITGYDVYPPHSQRLNEVIDLGIKRVSVNTRGIYDRTLTAQKDYLHTIVKKESGGKVKAQNKRSTAFGMFPVLELYLEEYRS